MKKFIKKNMSYTLKLTIISINIKHIILFGNKIYNKIYSKQQPTAAAYINSEGIILKL